MRHKYFILVFATSLLFCYFASVKEIYVTLFLLIIALVLFEKAKDNELFLLKVVAPFYVIPLTFYNKVFGIFALILTVILFSALYILRHVKKINSKKLGRVFFIVMFFVYCYVFTLLLTLL